MTPIVITTSTTGPAQFEMELQGLVRDHPGARVVSVSHHLGGLEDLIWHWVVVLEVDAETARNRVGASYEDTLEI